MSSNKNSRSQRSKTDSVRPVRPMVLEKQIYDLNASLTCANAFGTVQLSSLAQGSGFNNRDGSIIHPESITVRGVVAFDPVGSNTCRVILARLRYDGANLTATDAVSPTGGVNWNMTGAYNRDFVGQSEYDRRLVILKDEVFVAGPNWHSVHHFEWRIPVGGIIRYINSNASNVPVDGALVLFYADAPTTAVHATIQHYSRLTFTDA